MPSIAVGNSRLGRLCRHRRNRFPLNGSMFGGFGPLRVALLRSFLPCGKLKRRGRPSPCGLRLCAPLRQAMEACFGYFSREWKRVLRRKKSRRRRGCRRHGGEPARQGGRSRTWRAKTAAEPPPSTLQTPLLLCASARVGADEITRRRGERGGEKSARDGRMDGRQLSIPLLSPANSLSPLSQ